MENVKPFGVAVRDLLIEHGFTTAMGNPNWAAFALELPTLHYETLRKAVTGERPPGPKVMEEVAETLGVDPLSFQEYALVQAQRAFDPREVGTDQALANLEAWQAVRSAAPTRSARRKR